MQIQGPRQKPFFFAFTSLRDVWELFVKLRVSIVTARMSLGHEDGGRWEDKVLASRSDQHKTELCSPVVRSPTVLPSSAKSLSPCPATRTACQCFSSSSHEDDDRNRVKQISGSCLGASATFSRAIIGILNLRLDGDVILHATHSTDSRNFEDHRLFLSFALPVFKDMFKVPRPPSPSSNVDITDPPRTLELILRLIYPFASPVIDDLTVLLEVLILADKYDAEAARSRLRPCLAEFAKTEPLRVHAIACRLGFEGEMKIASSHTISINLP